MASYPKQLFVVSNTDEDMPTASMCAFTKREMMDGEVVLADNEIVAEYQLLRKVRVSVDEEGVAKIKKAGK